MGHIYQHGVSHIKEPMDWAERFSAKEYVAFLKARDIIEALPVWKKYSSRRTVLEALTEWFEKP